ncbi:chaperone modulator CbpM [Vannielia sp.]|uniref:chaperone modulator CbpM n=1 Tax=Vannielia sp. TaxID=2813045 RepID=UPI0026247AC2|nr:chaperone modulator CbpM [Vannielia sp.]MDF1871611.1 chaperone modulator CbpM [Vannielia sp.]
MTERYSESDVITMVTRLTRRELVRYVEVEFVRPQPAEEGYVFSAVDIARLELLCDLSQDLELDENALQVVIPLLDQLHTVRQDLARMARALDKLPAELRSRIGEEMKNG